MPANYPTSVPSFTNKSAGQTIASAHINSLQDEVVAIGSGLLQGTAPLASSNSTVAGLSVLGGSTLGGGLRFSSTQSINLSSGNTSGVALGSSMVVVLIAPHANGSTLRGLVTATQGRCVWVVNAGASNLVLDGESVDGNSTASMHFAADSTIAPGYSAMMVGTGNRWAIVRAT